MQRAIDAALGFGVPDSTIWGRAPELTQCRERKAEVDKLVAKAVADAKSEMAAAADDGLGARDSVADLRAAADRMTRAAENAGAAGAGDAPEMAPLKAPLEAVTGLVETKAPLQFLTSHGLAHCAGALEAANVTSVVALTEMADDDLAELAKKLEIGDRAPFKSAVKLLRAK